MTANVTFFAAYPAVLAELLSRFLLYVLFFVTEELPPFIRVIQPEEYWLYRFPSSTSFVTSNTLYVSDVISHVFSPGLIIFTGFGLIGLVYAFNEKRREAYCALYVITLALPLTGIVTNIIKIAVGRPRPDFFSRCYGSNYLIYKNLDTPCTGNPKVVMDGRKSFPSGHSSMSFCVFGFAFFYIAGQLGTFAHRGKAKAWTLVVTILPLLCAMLVAISRTCDYHHHWQDVSVGSLLGLTVSYVVYRQYFHGITDLECDKSYYVTRTTSVNPSRESLSTLSAESSQRSMSRIQPNQASNSKGIETLYPPRDPFLDDSRPSISPFSTFPNNR